MRRYISIFLLIYVFGIGSSVAMDGLTPEQEVLYQAIVQEVRCLVCQNQSIAESNAELAMVILFFTNPLLTRKHSFCGSHLSFFYS